MAEEIPPGHWRDLEITVYSQDEPTTKTQSRTYDGGDLKPEAYVFMAKLAHRCGFGALADDGFQKALDSIARIPALSVAVEQSVKLSVAASRYRNLAVFDAAAKLVMQLSRQLRNVDRGRLLMEVGRCYLRLGLFAKAEEVVASMHDGAQFDEDAELEKEIAVAILKSGDSKVAIARLARLLSYRERNDGLKDFCHAATASLDFEGAIDAWMRFDYPQGHVKLLHAVVDREEQLGLNDEARRTFALVFPSHHEGDDALSLIGVLGHLSASAGSVQDRVTALNLLEKATELAKSIKEVPKKESQLAAISEHFGRTGAFEKAKATFEEISDEDVRFRVSIALADAFLSQRVPYYEQFLRFAHASIETAPADSYRYEWQVKDLARALAASGRVNDAIGLAQGILKESLKSEVIVEIVKSAARSSSISECDASILETPDDIDRLVGMSELAIVYAQREDRVGAHKALLSAFRALRVVRKRRDYKNSSRRARAIGKLARALWHCGRVKQARRMFGRARGSVQYGDSIADLSADHAKEVILRDQVECGDLEEAHESCRYDRSDYERKDISRRIETSRAIELTQAGRLTKR